MSTPKNLTCVNCGAVVPTGFEASDDAAFELSGTVDCPSCGQSNDLRTVPMAPLEYSELVEWLGTPALSEVPIPQPALAGPCRAFASNLHGVILLPIFPAVSAHAEKLNQLLFDVATVKKTGQLGRPTHSLEITVSDMTAALAEVQGNGTLGGIRTFADVARGIERHFTMERKMRQGAQQMLSSCLVGSWTAFETLAGDLWEAMVNARPRLAIKLGKPIKSSILEKYGFNLDRIMGLVMSEMDAVSFTKLDNIRTAYGSIFAKEHGESITAALDDKSLDALSLVRNLIVHKAGRCDAEFKRRATGLPQLPQLEIGQPLFLTGGFVKHLLAPVFECCKRLMNEADQWLLNHPA